MERKLQFVALWMANIERENEARALQFRQRGAAKRIISAMRAHRLRVFLRRLVFWRKMELVMHVQRRFRGFMQRKKYRALQKEIQRRELHMHRAATRIQTCFRRHFARTSYLQIQKEKARARTARYEQKLKLLEKVSYIFFLTCI